MSIEAAADRYEADKRERVARSRAHAAKWKFDVDSMSDHDVMDLRLPVAETHEMPNVGSGWRRIQLVSVNGLWGACYSFQFVTSGIGFGPVPGHCTPHRSRMEAVESVLDYLREAAGRQGQHEGNAREMRATIHWLEATFYLFDLPPMT